MLPRKHDIHKLANTQCHAPPGGIISISFFERPKQGFCKSPSPFTARISILPSCFGRSGCGNSNNMGVSKYLAVFVTLYSAVLEKLIYYSCGYAEFVGAFCAFWGIDSCGSDMCLLCRDGDGLCRKQLRRLHYPCNCCNESINPSLIRMTALILFDFLPLARVLMQTHSTCSIIRS
jgi:hypothetical protein